jgi:Zn finger protein HypA/HybF involved in hydrogenase expression
VRKQVKVRAECEECSCVFDLYIRLAPYYECPKCGARYNALKVVNDPENVEILKKYELETARRSKEKCCTKLR